MSTGFGTGKKSQFESPDKFLEKPNGESLKNFFLPRVLGRFYEWIPRVVPEEIRERFYEKSLDEFQKKSINQFWKKFMEDFPKEFLEEFTKRTLDTFLKKFETAYILGLENLNSKTLNLNIIWKILGLNTLYLKNGPNTFHGWLFCLENVWKVKNATKI